MAAPIEAIAAAEPAASTLTCGERNGPEKRTSSAKFGTGSAMPLRTFGWNPMSSVSLRKSSVPLADTPSLAVSIAIERSTRAIPLASGKRTTAQVSSVDGSVLRNGLTLSRSWSTDASSGTLVLTSVPGPDTRLTFPDALLAHACGDAPRMARFTASSLLAPRISRFTPAASISAPSASPLPSMRSASAVAAGRTGIDGKTAGERAAQGRGAERRYVELASGQRQPHAQVVERLPVRQRQAAERQRAVRIERVQQCEVDGNIGEDPVRSLGRGRRGR